jgi:hypothetical protein
MPEAKSSYCSKGVSTLSYVSTPLYFKIASVLFFTFEFIILVTLNILKSKGCYLSK